SLLTPQGDLWRHLADTQLADIFVNTLVLLIVVGLGTTIIGAGTAWLVTMCSFPGSHRLEPRRLLVPRSRLGRCRRPPLHTGALSLRLPRRPHRLPDAVTRTDRGE